MGTKGCACAFGTNGCALIFIFANWGLKPGPPWCAGGLLWSDMAKRQQELGWTTIQRQPPQYVGSLPSPTAKHLLAKELLCVGILTSGSRHVTKSKPDHAHVNITWSKTCCLVNIESNEREVLLCLVWWGVGLAFSSESKWYEPLSVNLEEKDPRSLLYIALVCFD